jgi:hypothetical protein
MKAANDVYFHSLDILRGQTVTESNHRLIQTTIALKRQRRSEYLRSGLISDKLFNQQTSYFMII